MSTKRLVVVVLGGAVVVALVIGFAIVSRAPSETTKDSSLTNPVSAIVKNRNISIGGRIALQNELQTFANESRQQKRITNYGIYFRELISGPVIALNQQEGFFSASLLKLPVAIWYFKQAETKPELLSQQIQFTGPKGISVEHYPPVRTVEEGETYTIEELIELMLAESDNDATQILVEYAGGREVINQVYNDLGIRDVENYDTYIIDTHTYAGLFRVLFNAEYLDEASSEKVLSMLAKTSFAAGVTAHIPRDVTVAHKFGERTINPEADINQLHDCGIVYAPDNPYLLCVMTQGTDYEVMAEFIAEVSNKIYRAASAAELRE